MSLGEAVVVRSFILVLSLFVKGYILVPLLFLMYINDLAKVLTLIELIIIADHTFFLLRFRKARNALQFMCFYYYSSSHFSTIFVQVFGMVNRYS